MSSPSNTQRPGSGDAPDGPGDPVVADAATPQGPAPGAPDDDAKPGDAKPSDDGATADAGVIVDAGGAGASAVGPATPSRDPVTAALDFLPPAEGDGEDGQQAGAAHMARHPAQRGRPLRAILIGAVWVLLLVTGGVLLVPRSNSTPLEAVDVVSAGRAARSQLGFTPAVPVGPQGWTVTSALVRHGTDGILTWHVGMMTDRGNFAGFEQAEHSTFTWENALDAGGKRIGPVDVDGVAWDHMEKVERGTTTLILRRYGKVTLVTAHGGGIPDAMTLIRSLPPDALS